ncbi:MAG: thioesterase domain-containing protein, partial [Bacteroidota bacterium]
LPQVQINNHYGPTETTVDAIVAENVHSFDRNIIGRPIANTSAYIVGEADELVPIGVVGELLIGGEGVGKGYLGKKALTDQKFIENPFDRQATRLYRTGDLARWHTDGNIEFIGRRDDQVKVRGYRIELGEVEAVLSACPLVNQAVVVAKENGNGDKKLIAYIVAGVGYTLEKVKDFLTSKLPSYMLPALFVPIEELPLTENGKINKKALPTVEASDLLRHKYVAPRSELETQLAEIWQAQLELEKVGVFDNFFELGGHSLLSMSIVDAIAKTIGRTITIRDFYQNPSIASIAAFFETAAKQSNDLAIPLNQVIESNRSVFMIPPILGSPLVYQNLANLLAPAQMSCYGFEYPGFNVGDDFATSIESMAEVFVQEIILKIEHEEEPILILGYSMGAIVAFELVHQLEAIGRTCQLILLDSTVPNHTQARKEQEIDEKLAQQFVQNHLQQTNLKQGREKQLKKLVLHYSTISDSYTRMDKKLLSPILAFEAAKRKQEVMLEWQYLTQGMFNHHLIDADHFGILDQKHLPQIVHQIVSTFK